MKEKGKKNSKKKVLCGVALGTIFVAGVGYLSYKKIPQFKTFVDGLISCVKSSISTTKTPEIKTKPFRKYETLNKKR